MLGWMTSSPISRIPTKWLLVFTFINLVLVQLVSTLYVYQSGVYPSTLYAWLFLLVYWFGHLFFLSAVSSLVTIPILLIGGGGKWARCLIATLAAAILIFLFIDTFVYAQYRFHINFIVLDLFLNGHGQIISFSNATWALMVGLLIGVLTLEIYLAEWVSRRSFGSLKKIVLFYLACFLVSQFGHAWADANYYTPVTRLAGIFPLSAPLQSKTLFAKYGLIDVEEVKKRKQLRQDFEKSDLRYPLSPVECSAPAKLPNIVWIVVDSLRADMLTEQIMPNTSKLARQSAVFEDHFSNSNSTRHGVFGLFYGIPGSYFDAALKNRVPPVFVAELAKNNYEFGIFANAPLTKPEFDQTVFLPVPNLRTLSKSKTIEGRDIEITDEAVEFLSRRDSGRPFFTFVFYDGPHGYAYPKDIPLPFPQTKGFNYLSLNANSDPTEMRQAYSNSVYFNDVQLGRIMQILRDKNFDSSTIVLITGDHGQEFNDNKKGYWGHNSNYSRPQTHVPLVLFWPGKDPERISERTTHFDVSTTFLTEVFGCANPENFSTGSNLFDRKGREWFMMGREGDYAIRSGETTTVVYPTGDFDIVDESYTPIPGAKLDGRIMGEALKEMRRFTR